MQVQDSTTQQPGNGGYTIMDFRQQLNYDIGKLLLQASRFLCCDEISNLKENQAKLFP